MTSQGFVTHWQSRIHYWSYKRAKAECEKTPPCHMGASVGAPACPDGGSTCPGNRCICLFLLQAGLLESCTAASLTT